MKKKCVFSHAFYRDLSSNDFRFLHQHQFQNLSQLTTLNLGTNDIVEIPDDAFHGLTSLDNL